MVDWSAQISEVQERTFRLASLPVRGRAVRGLGLEQLSLLSCVSMNY